MKKKLFSILAVSLLGAGLSLASCGGTNENNGGNGGNNNPPTTDTEKLVTDITLTEESKTLGIGATYQLEWTVAPSDAVNKDVTFASSDTKVATVSENGLVTAVAVGTSTITVSSADNGDVTTSFALTVEEVKYVKEIEALNYTSTYIYTNADNEEKTGYEIEMEYVSTYQIEYKIVTPESEYNDDTVIFYADPSDEYTVSEDGLVTMVEGFDSEIYVGAYNPEQFSHKGEMGWARDCIGDITIKIK